MSHGDQNKPFSFDNQTFKIGSRKSQLALVQTHQVKGILEENYKNGTKFEVIDMSTKGDEVLDRALYKIGDKSLFTKELENALISGEVDMVVHSLKDLPSTLPEGLVIGAVLQRVQSDDVIVIKESSKFKTWEEIVSSPGSVIGTSSVRRGAQLRGKYPNLAFQDIRGNLNTRLKKLDDPNGPYEALILAAAGILRLDWHHRIHRALRPDECLQAVGQGALAVECRSDDKKILALLKPLNDKATVQAVMAERAFMKFLDGGCSAPLAGHAQVENGQLVMDGGVWSLDGKTNVRSQIKVTLHDELKDNPEVTELSAISIPFNESKSCYVQAQNAGIDLAKQLVAQGAKEVLLGAKSQVHAMRENV